ncbi:hypothetical protein KY347_02755 [Candidatus Woesearchaeota archaeon]|nr:hypothetical protein [Candidatus Woesearchaeota archaeon]
MKYKILRAYENPLYVIETKLREGLKKRLGSFLERKLGEDWMYVPGGELEKKMDFIDSIAYWVYSDIGYSTFFSEKKRRIQKAQADDITALLKEEPHDPKLLEIWWQIEDARRNTAKILIYPLKPAVAEYSFWVLNSDGEEGCLTLGVKDGRVGSTTYQNLGSTVPLKIPEIFLDDETIKEIANHVGGIEKLFPRECVEVS